MNLVFSPAAEADLEEIGDYIALDNPLRAISFIQDIRDHCQVIVRTPEAIPLRDDLLPGIRMSVHGRYLIFHHVDNNSVRIERILHGARNIAGLIEG
ncbi:MAG: type II toxin-antitoxin system RelE/ParE family toxin [Rhodospirillales bacterium]|nr:type II toxin-antitoxin system RelE/ParE family toxin [Rhodospirillales bacterium]